MCVLWQVRVVILRPPIMMLYSDDLKKRLKSFSVKVQMQFFFFKANQDSNQLYLN